MPRSVRGSDAALRPVRRYRPEVELLEDRLVLAVVGVDAGADQHWINPAIYGIGTADTATLNALNIQFSRVGGNATTRYNWQQNASNRASDWFYESIGYNSATPGAEYDALIGGVRDANGDLSVTIPILGWVAKLGPNRSITFSYPKSKFPNQQAFDFWQPNAGNGLFPNGSQIPGADPNDANTPADANFQAGWIQHMIQQWGNAGAGGQRFYTLDNEPDLWHETHRDVLPTGITMEQLRDRIITYATMIKSIDPNAQVEAGELSGYLGLLISGYDLWWGTHNGWGGALPDQSAHGGQNIAPWLLNELRLHDQATGSRSVDYFTTHFYPQAGEFSNAFSGLENPTDAQYAPYVTQNMQLLRNRSTRSLWDPNYVNESWIADLADNKVNLIPRLHQWVAANYAGTKLGLTEYNWGAERHMNGATAQADVLGIMGREGMDLANIWAGMSSNLAIYNTFKMYRNYDGLKSTFGDTSVRTTMENPDQVSAFSAVRGTDGALTVMVVNKNLYNAGNPGATTSVTVNLANFQGAGVAQRWQLAATNPAANVQNTTISHQNDVSFGGTSFTVNVPMQSVTLFVIAPGQTQPQPGQFQFSLSDFQVNENGGTATITVNRINGADGTVSVQYQTANGTATAGQDYTAANGTLTFNQGETSKTFQVNILQDTLVELAETLTLTLSNPMGGATLGSPSTANLTIQDDDVVVPVTRRVNFTATGSASPSGWFSDTGLTFGNRGNGQSYGWNRNLASLGYGKDRNAANSPNEMQDSLMVMQTTAAPNPFWEMAVTNGRYRVHVGMGDPIAFTGFYKLNVEGVLAVNGKPSTSRRWVEGTITVNVTDGRLTLKNNPNGSQNNRINFVEVTPLPPVGQGDAINAGGWSATNFSADFGFTGGQIASTSAAIDTSGVVGAAAQEVYQSERYGDFTYGISQLTAGASYKVRLHFAEIYWDAVGQRVFHVRINGQQVLTNFDIVAAAGSKNKAVVREFTVTADAQGKLSLQFLSVVNFAKVSGIEVVKV
jgi:hypothetical protein